MVCRAIDEGSTETDQSTLPLLGLLVDTLDRAGVGVLCTTPEAMTTLIRRMVDDCVGVGAA